MRNLSKLTYSVPWFLFFLGGGGGFTPLERERRDLILDLFHYKPSVKIVAPTATLTRNERSPMLGSQNGFFHSKLCNRLY